MSLAHIRREARRGLHLTMAEAVFASVSRQAGQVAWMPLRARINFRGDKPVDSLALGGRAAMSEITETNPRFVYLAADAPDLGKGGVIFCDAGAFSIEHEPRVDRDGYATVDTSKLSKVLAAALQKPDPVLAWGI